jgi:hypothetical protein
VKHRRFALFVLAAVGDPRQVAQWVDFLFNVEQQFMFSDQIDVAAQVLWHEPITPLLGNGMVLLQTNDSMQTQGLQFYWSLRQSSSRQAGVGAEQDF